MKKKVFVLALAAALLIFKSSAPLFSNETPSPLKGIWEGSDRYVLFSENAVALKTFYGWYLDRTAESDSYTTAFKRDRNDTTNEKTPEKIEIAYKTLIENEEKTSGAYEITISYGKGKRKEASTIPIAVIDKKLYLHFLLKKDLEENKIIEESEHQAHSEQFMNGFWKNFGHASGVKVSTPIRDKELYSYYFNESDVYYIRYWLTDFEASEKDIEETKASFSDGEKVFYVDKFIKNGDLLYTCATGRSTTIRNISKTSASNMKFLVDERLPICVLEDEYLTKIEETGAIEAFQKIVSENNSRRKPAPKPLFPPSNVNFHWKEISELEKYNPWTWNRRNIDLHK